MSSQTYNECQEWQETSLFSPCCWSKNRLRLATRLEDPTLLNGLAVEKQRVPTTLLNTRESIAMLRFCFAGALCALVYASVANGFEVEMEYSVDANGKPHTKILQSAGNDFVCSTRHTSLITE